MLHDLGLTQSRSLCLQQAETEPLDALREIASDLQDAQRSRTTPSAVVCILVAHSTALPASAADADLDAYCDRVLRVSSRLSVEVSSAPTGPDRFSSSSACA